MAYTTINKPSLYFNTVTYSGNGINPTSITSVEFKPDWLWIKSRSNATANLLFDAVRGVNKRLVSNLANAESTETTIASFDTNGWTMDADTGNNGSGRTYVAWNWLANNTSGSTNTAGSITSTVAANTTSGFSIVTYAGSSSNVTVGHGLGIAPKMILIKDRTVAYNWQVYHASLGADKYIEGLNTTAAASTGTLIWQNTTPTSSIFYLGGNVDGSNKSGSNQIAYCFADVKGYSKMGSYTGNGSANGTFVYTGFKPRYFMVKRTDSAGNDWILMDTVRDPINVATQELYANLAIAEGTASNNYDILSNGFKARRSNAAVNASGGTYIYMAFAENPFVSSTSIPTTAR